MSFLLDTDICSAHLKGNTAVWQKTMQYGGRLHVSTVTIAELQVWILRSGMVPARVRDVDDFLVAASIHPVDEEVARKFGEVRAAQMNQGQVTPDLDLLIASTALVHGLALVTHNVADYVNVPGLTIEDWLTP